MTKLELTNILSRIHDWENGKEFVYSLEIDNPPYRYQPEVYVYIIKYNLNDFYTALNEIFTMDTKSEKFMRHMEDKCSGEIALKRAVSIYWTAVRVTPSMYQEQRDLVITDVFIQFMNDLNRYATPTLIHNKLKAQSNKNPL